MAWSGVPRVVLADDGAALGALCYTIQLPGWWAIAASVPIAAALVMVAHAASRARGVCEGWVNRAMPPRDRIVLYVPAAGAILVGAAGSKFASWPAIVAAVPLFTLFAGTGLTLSARAARR